MIIFVSWAARTTKFTNISELSSCNKSVDIWSIYMSADSLTLKSQESKDGKLMNCLLKVSANNLNIKTLAESSRTLKKFGYKKLNISFGTRLTVRYIFQNPTCASKCMPETDWKSAPVFHCFSHYHLLIRVNSCQYLIISPVV